MTSNQCGKRRLVVTLNHVVLSVTVARYPLTRIQRNTESYERSSVFCSLGWWVEPATRYCYCDTEPHEAVNVDHSDRTGRQTD